MHFEWDPRKDRKNTYGNRKLRFEEAKAVFYDPFAIYEPDPDHGERTRIIGRSGPERVLFVVYADLSEEEYDIIRIISVRKATTQERRKYEHGDE